MLKSLNKINLGCGDVYIEADNWVNLDYNPVAPPVKFGNLLGRFPLNDNSACLVYSSHFFEHIPRNKIPFFLKECKRILAPGGVIRLVLPDLENLCRAYLGYRERGEHEYADIVILQMIDQCVRLESGGELGRLYSRLKAADPRPDHIINFIREQNGEDLLKENSNFLLSKSNPWNLINSIKTHLKRLWILAVLSFLPKAFRLQNVSLAAVGEKHQWIWDFYQIKSVLKDSGFININRYSVESSSIVDFPFFPLDIDKEGRPRKGLESMYIEGQKPEI